MSHKKKDQLSEAMKRTSEWILSQDIPSDVTVLIGEVPFSLHKYPLVSKSGLITKLVAEAPNPDGICVIEMPDVPGGEEGFELVAKFCYGINFDLGTENIAQLRCVAEYLEMTEEYGEGNLLQLTESYLNEVVLQSLASAVAVLHQSESLLPMSEKVKLVSRCVDAIAILASSENHFSVSENGDNGYDGLGLIVAPPRSAMDWWVEDLTVLRIGLFQRVLISMMARGFKQYALGPMLMLYAQKSLRGLEKFRRGKKLESHLQHEKRVVLETIVSLLPREKNAMSVSFLSMLLRASMYLETTVACKLDLEKRMGLQLSHAALDDILIPSYSFTGDTLFDVETVKRILGNYHDAETKRDETCFRGDDDFVSTPTLGDSERVRKLMEIYLAEIASDQNLSVLKFINIVELIPEKSRDTGDGMYRAIDIYLTAHPALNDLEKKRICGLMDCQKLSREACAHAAKNDRLPIKTVGQVLYCEQQRLQEGTSGRESPAPSSKQSVHHTESPKSVQSELPKLKNENEELKSELLKMKMKMKEIEKKQQTAKAGVVVRGSPLRNAPVLVDKPPLPGKSFINSMSKKLAALVRIDVKARMKPSRDRRHSVS